MPAAGWVSLPRARWPRAATASSSPAATRTGAAAAALRDEGLDVQALPLDVDVPSSIAAAAQQVQRMHGLLDVLVNNTGVLPEATDTTEHDFADPQVFQTTFATNLFGAVAVTEAFLPLLRRSASGRIVNVSTTMGSLKDQANPDSPYYQVIVPAYQASKAALNSVTISLAKKLADTDTKVTAVCPGFVQTDLTPVNREQAPLSADQGAAIIVTAATLAPTRPPAGSSTRTARSPGNAARRDLPVPRQPQRGERPPHRPFVLCRTRPGTSSRDRPTTAGAATAPLVRGCAAPGADDTGTDLR